MPWAMARDCLGGNRSQTRGDLRFLVESGQVRLQEKEGKGGAEPETWVYLDEGAFPWRKTPAS